MIWLDDAAPPLSATETRRARAQMALFSCSERKLVRVERALWGRRHQQRPSKPTK